MRKTIVRFFTVADYEEEEIWLREQHKNGWKLAGLTPPCFYHFESCEPQDVIYRLAFQNSEQTDEYMQMLKDFGWEYFDHCLGWLYFRKPAESAESEADGELFSDNASRDDMAGHVLRTRLLPILLIFFCCVLPNLINAIRGKTSSFSGVFGAFYSVAFVIYVYLILHVSIKLKKIRDRYKN